MIDLTKGVAAIVVILSTAALPANAFAEEANFGLLGALLGAKTPDQTEAAPKPAETSADEVPTKTKSQKGRSASLRGAPSSNIKVLIAQHAAANGVPVALADAIVRIESRYNPRATNHGAMGLMQIKAQTARGVGFSGSASELLNADTNLRYGMKYLAQVYKMSGGNVCSTVMRYQTGVAATHLSAANRAYCAKAKAIMASL